jgi:hypothetical protein
MEIQHFYRVNLLSRGSVGTLIWMYAAAYANGVGRIENGRWR